MAKLFSDLADLKFEADAESARPLFKTPWLDEHIATQQAKRDAEQVARDAAAAAQTEARLAAATKAAEPPTPPSVLKEGIDPADPNHPSNYFSQAQIGRSTVDERRARTKAWMATQANNYLTPYGIEQYRAELGRKVDNAFGITKNSGVVEGAADIGLSAAQGAVGSVKAITGVFGDNFTSEWLGKVSEKLGDLKSVASKVDSAAVQAKIKEAEASGSTIEEIKAYFNAFLEQPAEMLAQGIGSFATVGFGKAAQAIKGAQAIRTGATAVQAAAGASKAGTATNIAVGAAQGLGGVKNQQYEQVYNQAKEQNVSDELARDLASKAQSYSKENFIRHAAGFGLGAWASSSGVEAALIAGKAAGKAGVAGAAMTVAKGAGKEAIPEAAQSAQEAEAGNDAAIRAKLLEESQRYQGVAGQAVQAAAIGGILGGSVDLAVGSGQVAKVTPPTAPVNPPVSPPSAPSNPAQNAAGASVSNAAPATENIVKTPAATRTPEQTTARVQALREYQELLQTGTPAQQRVTRLLIAEEGLATNGELKALMSTSTTIGQNGEIFNSNGELLDATGVSTAIPVVPNGEPKPIGDVAPPTAVDPNAAGNANSQGDFQSGGRSAKAVEEIRVIYETLSPEDKIVYAAQEAEIQAEKTEPVEQVATGRTLKAAVGREVTYKGTTGSLAFDKDNGKYTVTALDGTSVNVLPSLGKIKVPRDVSTQAMRGTRLPEVIVEARRESISATKKAVRAETRAATKAESRAKQKTATDFLVSAVAVGEARDAKQPAAQANAKPVTAKDLVGKFVQYGQAQGFLQERASGLYVVDTKSNSDVFVESGRSQRPASELGMDVMRASKSTTLKTQPRAVPPPTPAPTPYTRPANPQALAAGKAMDKGAKAAGKEAAKLAKRAAKVTVSEQKFYDAVDLLTLEYGDEAAGYILDQIEIKLGVGIKREKIIKEIENAINTGYTPFANAQGNGAGNSNIERGQTTADGTGGTQGVASLQSRADSVTETPAFKAWFAGSKVVNLDGTPRRVYTGTSADKDFDAFRMAKNGVWFTDSPESASSYAVENDSMGLEYNPNTRRFDAVNSAARVVPVYLNITNPYKLMPADLQRINTDKYKSAQAKLFNELRLRGFDGVQLEGGVWVAIGQAGQIKSAIGNNGNFDGSKPSILKNEAGTTTADNRLNDVFAQQGVNATLDLIAKEGSTFDRSVIRAIREHVQLVESAAQQSGAMQKGVLGEYNPTTRQIWLAPGASQATVLHELVHAAVDTVMHTDITALSERQRKAVVTLHKMYAFAAANPRWEGRYAMTDVHEFIAEAMSNQKFQAELHSVSVQELLRRPGESMWTAFTDSIKRILGVDKDTLRSSLLTTRRLLDDLVSAPTNRQSEVLRLINQRRQKAPERTVTGFVAARRDQFGTAFGDYGYVGLNQLQDERDAAKALGTSAGDKLAKAVEDVRQKIVLKDDAGAAERMAKVIAQPVEDLIKSLAKAGGLQPNDLRRVASEVAIAQHSAHLSKAWEVKARAELEATETTLDNYEIIAELRTTYETQARSIASEIDNFYNLNLGKAPEDIDYTFIAGKVNELDELMRVLGEAVVKAGATPGVSPEAALKMNAALVSRRSEVRRSQDARRAIEAAQHQSQYLKNFLGGVQTLGQVRIGMVTELQAWDAAQSNEPTPDAEGRLQFVGAYKLPGGMRIIDAEKIITDNAADPDSEAVNAVAEAYRNAFRQLSEKAVELNIVSPEAATALRTANPFYVNTQGTGETDKDANLNERNYRGFLDKAEGSSHYLNSNDVFTNLALRINKLAQVDSSLALGKAAMTAIRAGSKDWELHLPDQSGRNYVRATVGGETVFLAPVRKELDKAIGGPDAMNAALKKWAATPTRVYGQLFTTYTAAFAPLSYVRDGLTRTFNLRGRASELVREDGTFVSVAEARTRVGAQMANPITWLEGFKHAYAGINSPALQELIDAGGLTTFSEIVNTERKIEGQFAKGRGLERVKEEFVKWNKAFEVAQVLASYKGLREAGIGSQQASFTGLDMMNFRRSGETTSGVLKAFYLYANPVAQDIRGFTRNIIDRNGKLNVWGAVDVGVMFGVGTALFAMAREASDDDELGGKVIDSMSDKELYSVVPIKISDSVTIKIPIGFGWPQVAYTWAVAKKRADLGLITEQTAQHDSLKAFFSTFAVTGISDASYQRDLPLALLQMVMPDLLAPVVSAATGKNFMGGPITGNLKADINKSDQGKWRTPEVYKQIAQTVQKTTGVDLAPESVQAVATGYAGGLLAIGLDIGLGLEQDRVEKGLSKDYAPTAVERALGLSRWYTRSDLNKQAQASFYREKEQLVDMQRDFNSEAPKGLGREKRDAKLVRLATGGATPVQIDQLKSLAAYEKEARLVQERWKQANARRKGGEDISALAETIVADEITLQTKFVKDVRKARGEQQ